MTTGDRIKLARVNSKLTQEELADRIGVQKSAIAKYENGRVTNLKRDTIHNLARVLNVAPSWLMGFDENGQDEPEFLPSNINRITDTPHHYVPLIGSVAGGVPILAEQNYDCYIDAPRKADFALKLEGDSMSPSFLPGDVIYIKQQSDVDDGQVGVVLIDDSATLKRIHHLPDGLLLLGDNPRFKPLTVKPAEHDCVRILGTVCGFTRMF